MKRQIALQFGSPPWTLRTRFRYYRQVLFRTFVLGDTNSIRVELGVASVLFAFFLLPLFHTFERPAFRFMTFMPYWAWALIFVLHSIGVLWRQIDPVPRIVWGLLINSYGLFIWVASTALISVGVGEPSPSIALELTVIARAFVALMRTGLNNEDISP